MMKIYIYTRMEKYCEDYRAQKVSWFGGWKLKKKIQIEWKGMEERKGKTKK